MTCKECLHFDACVQILKKAYPSISDERIDEVCSHQHEEKPCPVFKNKADFVEVTRCEDCGHFTTMCCTGWCSYHDVRMCSTDFCSYGERKEEK